MEENFYTEEILDISPINYTTQEDEYERKNKNRNKNKNKIENCKVLAFDPKEKTLDIDFKGYGIRLCNVENIENKEYIEVKYYGEIGNRNFKVEL